MDRRLIIVVLFLFAAGTATVAQAPRAFTNDSTEFTMQLSALFQTVADKDNQAEAMETAARFSELWQSGRFTGEQQQFILNTCNQMLKKRVKPYPDFLKYLYTLTVFKEQKHPEKSFNIWLHRIYTMLATSRNSRGLKKMVAFTQALLDENILYRSGVFTWYCEDKYRFVDDTVLCLKIPEFNLRCRTKYDSTIIKYTSGKYFPESARWAGVNGKVPWSRAGLDDNKTYAVLNSYTISLNAPFFEIDSVVFVNKKYFPDALLGKLSEKVSSNKVSPDKVYYPQFESYAKNLYIGNIYPDVDFEGGFGMKGAKIFGTGDQYHLASFTFKKEYKNKKDIYDILVARSKNFIINHDIISASRAAVTIYHQEDSIFHSGLLFKYIHKDREISMLRIEPGVMQSPYFDTFHNIEIYCEAVYWDMDEPFINFRAVKGLSKVSSAFFSSQNFYDERQFRHLQGIDFQHPLIRIRDYSRKYNTDEFYIYELARFLKLPDHQVEAEVIYLAQQGFIIYDLDNKKGVITDKLIHFCDSKNAKADYDVITFSSEVESGDNATLEIDNFDLKIRGVPQVFISDSQNVLIYPSRQEVILRENLDFLFSGKIKAGLFEFYANDCYFEYDTFKLNMPDIEYMKFKVRSFTPDEYGQHPLREVNNVISNISGTLEIDYPTNKSGLKNYPEYPVFRTQSNAYVYYDYDSAYREAYNRERFYYYLDPFTIESLEDFSTDSLTFSGHLNSGGIFPDITAPLSVQPDYSLGFVTKTPEQGLPVYQGKGTYSSEILLSNKGLKGNGVLKYLSSKAESNNMIFFLDSVNADAQHFVMEKQIPPAVSFPDVEAVNVYQHWMPYADSMWVRVKDSAMVMYDQLASFDGELLLTPQSLTGEGKTAFFNAAAQSSGFTFSDHSFMADTAWFTIRSAEDEGLALSAERYRMNMDFDLLTGNFKTTGGEASITFPLNRFMCTMDEFDWYVEQKELVFRNYAAKDQPDLTAMPLMKIMDVNMAGYPKLISLHPLQDSLMFCAGSADYLLDSSMIIADGVRIIRVADAAVFPADGKVKIRKNAKIDRLSEATIIADTSNKQHVITDASVSLQSRYSFAANGNYTFYNAANQPQIIRFDNISVDTAYHTFARGEIEVGQEFLLSPQFGFRGEVTLNAYSPLLYFDGAYMPIQDCDPDYSKWVKFDQRLNPNRLYLPVPAQLHEFAEKKLYAAFFHSNENNRVYPAFLSRKLYYSDTMMLTVQGFVKTREGGKEFLIASEREIGIEDGRMPQDDYMSLNTTNCEVKASGEIRLGAKFDPVTMRSFGSIDHFIIPDSTAMRLYMLMDFPFPEEALNYMARQLDMANTEGINLNLSQIKTAYRKLLGEEQSNKVLSDLTLYGTTRQTPEVLSKSIVIGDVKMYYDKNTRSFRSVGPIGIARMLGNQVNKYYDGYLQIVRRRSGDVMNLYIEIDRRHWFFFTYKHRQMQALSSMTDFNKILREVKPEKRKGEGKEQKAYRFMISTQQTKARFLRSMRETENEE